MYLRALANATMNITAGEQTSQPEINYTGAIVAGVIVGSVMVICMCACSGSKYDK